MANEKLYAQKKFESLDPKALFDTLEKCTKEDHLFYLHKPVADATQTLQNYLNSISCLPVPEPQASSHHLIPITLKKGRSILLHIVQYTDISQKTKATLYDPQELAGRLSGFSQLKKIIRGALGYEYDGGVDTNVVSMGDQSLFNQTHGMDYVKAYAYALLQNGGKEIASFRQRNRGRLWSGLFIGLSGGLTLASYFGSAYLPKELAISSFSFPGSLAPVGFDILLGLGLLTVGAFASTIATALTDKGPNLKPEPFTITPHKASTTATPRGSKSTYGLPGISRTSATENLDETEADEDLQPTEERTGSRHEYELTDADDNEEPNSTGGRLSPTPRGEDD